MTSIIQWLDRHATATPDRPAASDGTTRWTYRELRARSFDVCGTVLAHTGGDAVPVLLAASTSLDTLAAMLGIMRAGCVAVAVDPVDGAARCEWVRGQVEPKLTLADATGEALIGGRGSLLRLEEIVSTSASDGPALASHDIARVVFTSGSTGEPKGFVFSHGSLVAISHVNQAVDMSPEGECFGHAYSLAFQASSIATCGALLVGGCHSLFSASGRQLSDLPSFMADEGVTWTSITPNLVRTLGTSCPDRAESPLRTVRMVGDHVLPADVATVWRVLAPQARVVVTYASTDTGPITAAIFRPGDRLPKERLPMGAAYPDRELRIVDDEGDPVAVGTAGLLEVTMPGPAPRRFTGSGSLAVDPQRDAQPVRVTIGDLALMDESGQIEMVGRATARVKVRGYGVDLVEVERALAAVQGVDTVAVVLEPDVRDPRLVAHVARADPSLTTARLLDAARGALPGYMVPSLVRWWDELPLTSRGKVDREVLTRASVGLSVGDEPSDVGEIEAALRKVWCEVLRLRSVGLDDRFFDVGGDSLLAYELVARLERDLGAIVSPASLLRAPTVREQAAALVDGRGTPRETLVRLREGSGERPILFVPGLGGSALACEPLLRHLPRNRPVWAFHTDRLDSRVASVADMADDLAGLVERASPSGAVTVIGWSWGGVLGWDLCRRLVARGISVEQLVLLDSRAPGRPDNRAVPASILLAFGTRRVSYAAMNVLRAAVSDPRRAWRGLRRRTARRGDTIPPEVEATRQTQLALSASWVPVPIDAAVSVVAAAGMSGYHRQVWGNATTGRFRIATVPAAGHKDLLSWRVRATGEILAAWLADGPRPGRRLGVAR